MEAHDTTERDEERTVYELKRMEMWLPTHLIESERTQQLLVLDVFLNRELKSSHLPHQWSHSRENDSTLARRVYLFIHVTLSVLACAAVELFEVARAALPRGSRRRPQRASPTVRPRGVFARTPTPAAMSTSSSPKLLDDTMPTVDKCSRADMSARRRRH